MLELWLKKQDVYKLYHKKTYIRRRPWSDNGHALNNLCYLLMLE